MAASAISAAIDDALCGYRVRAPTSTRRPWVDHCVAGVVARTVDGETVRVAARKAVVFGSGASSTQTNRPAARAVQLQ